MLTAYLMASISIVLLYVSGALLGVRIPAGRWLDMTLLILIGLVPFAAFGIFIGHQLTVDSIGPVMGGGISLLALLGGTWGPISDSGFFYDLARALPSYWLVQASHVALGGSAWGALGWGVMAAWSIVFSALALRAFRRDTARAQAPPALRESEAWPCDPPRTRAVPSPRRSPRACARRRPRSSRRSRRRPIRPRASGPRRSAGCARRSSATATGSSTARRSGA